MTRIAVSIIRIAQLLLAAFAAAVIIRGLGLAPAEALPQFWMAVLLGLILAPAVFFTAGWNSAVDSDESEAIEKVKSNAQRRRR